MRANPASAQRRRQVSIASQVAAIVLALVVAIIAAMSYTYARHARRQIDRLYSQRALSVAKAVASLETVRNAIGQPTASEQIQPIAERVRIASGADFVVVADRNQIRLSHPDPAKIGKKLSTDAGLALQGHDWTGVETGTLGRSVRGKTPIWDATHTEVIGIVSVGMLTESLRSSLFDAFRDFATSAGIVLLGGGGAAYAFWRRVRRQTFSLDETEIARLLEHREALLHGIREGILAIDGHQRITLLNDEAVRLLDIPSAAVGKSVTEVGLSGRLLDVILDDAAERDAIVLHGDRVLTMNRMPVRRRRVVGAVVTFRDRTELVNLEAELRGAESSRETLRAQAHEFSNRMHIVAGLLALGSYDEASTYVIGTARAQEAVTGAVLRQVCEPTIAALIVAKSALAHERNVELMLSPDSRIAAGDHVPVDDVTLVIGNLVDNALQALDGRQGWIEVDLCVEAEVLTIEVSDSGPGVTPDLAAEVFEFGFSTKAAAIDAPRGLGLALARQACVRHGGSIEVRANADGGALFVACLPLTLSAAAR